MSKTAELGRSRDTAADVGKAIAHPLRTDILTVLHDGPDCASGLAKQTGVNLGTIRHHIIALLEANAIEVAFSRSKGSHNVVFYRALTTSIYLSEDLAKISREQQHELNRIIVQSIGAEALSALSAGHLAGDRLASAAWDRVSLDHTGYEELSASCTDFISRLYAIAAAADKRMRLSGESPKVYVGAVLGFKRSRTKPATSAAVGGVGGLRLPRAEIVELGRSRDTAADVGKAIAHPLRTDILTVLHDGPDCASGLAKQTGVTLGTIGHHIGELLKAKAITEAFVEEARGHSITFYEAPSPMIYLSEDLARLSREQQHELNRIIVQSIGAEALSALSAGHLAGDPLASAAWDRVSLDGKGYAELSASCTNFISRLYATAAAADKRMRVSGESPKVYVGAVLGFKRSRTKPATSAAVENLTGSAFLE